MLSDSQYGIQLGLNGMAVGGKRRVTISPELVCGGIDQGCFLLRPERQFVNEIRIARVRWLSRPRLNLRLVHFRWRAGCAFTLVDISAGCGTKSEPKAGGSDWHIY
jgi:hypothetical protein